MRVIGLEPTHLAIPDPKSGASTNFATRAYEVQSYILFLIPQISGRKIDAEICYGLGRLLREWWCQSFVMKDDKQIDSQRNV